VAARDCASGIQFTLDDYVVQQWEKLAVEWLASSWPRKTVMN